MLENKVLPKESFFWYIPKKSLEVNVVVFIKFTELHLFWYLETSTDELTITSAVLICLLSK